MKHIFQWAGVLFLPLFSLFLSCSDDNGLSREESEQIQSIFGKYMVEDISGLDLESVYKDTQLVDPVFFTGVKNGCMWVAMFDYRTGEQLQEWIDRDPIRTVKEPLEYGEVNEVKPNAFRLMDLHKTDFGFAAYVRYEERGTEENNWRSNSANADVVFLHTKDSRFQIIKTMNDCISGMNRIHWYNDGVVVRLQEPVQSSGDYFACEPDGGNSYLESCPYEDDFPVSLYRGLRFRDYDRFYISLQDYTEGKELWEYRAPFLENIEWDARQTWTVTNQDELGVDFQVDIVHRNGDRDQITFSVSLIGNGGVYKTN